ncbi:glycosyltransferase [Histidinibacterium aquaticum]|uniref:Glycosyltransferase n=1 Tax=Histidinibacterium aquaticum TaxID=2613962 RepID=A0A5J5GAU3_9RHOB|nr:glycosyltransferase [Histidinibacterium aquaticum]KAA9005050.1 glycosyltransferase [Histidinibacterium aquaticum]
MDDAKAVPARKGASALRVMVCIRNLQSGAGGMERTAANLASYLASKGHILSIAYRENQKGSSLYHLADEIQHLPFDGKADSLVEVARRFSPDVIVYFYATSVEAPHIVALCQTNVPLVLHEGSNPGRVIGNNWAAPKGITEAQAELERSAMMASCTRLRFTLPQYRKSVPSTLQADSVAFPNAFPPADPVDISLRSQATRKIFLNIGGLKKVKNLIAAVRAFSLIADDLPDWDFHIFSAAPRANTIRPELEEFIDRKNLAGRVKIHDPTPLIGREYGRSHVHVISSKEEGLPNCVAEASRHGLPSIGFACCAGTNAMIIDDHNGLLVDCGTDEIQALAEAMRRAATDDTARNRWGATALQESAIYDPDRIFSQWEALIREAADDRVTPKERLLRRFGENGKWRQLRAVQRASLGASPWPVARTASATRPSGEAPPKVSIIVPLINKEASIAETLESIAACSYPKSSKEVVVVDDCLTDGSATIAGTICARNSWKLIRHDRNSGLSAARNTGLDAASGEFVHFWGAGDLYARDGLDTVICAMREDGADIGTGIAASSGQVLAQYTSSARDISAINFAGMPESLSTASTRSNIYRRKFLNEYGLRFEPDLYLQDSAFDLCAFPLAERIAMTSAVLGEYRRLENCESRQFDEEQFSSALRIEQLTYEHYTSYGIHGLDLRRQQHILEIVLPQFVSRSQRNYAKIDEKTDLSDLKFEFLAELQKRLPRLSQGLVSMTKSSMRLRLAYFAIREGYLAWLPSILAGKLPSSLRSDILAETPEEKNVVDSLIIGLSGEE